MSKKVVLKVVMDSERCIETLLERVAEMEGVESVDVDIKKNKMIVVGSVDHVSLLLEITRNGASAELLGIGPRSTDPTAQFNFTPPSYHTSFASTAKSTTKSNVVYDVVISHRGPNVKKGLASHLYRSLIRHGYRVFLDVEELEKGDALATQIEGAIRTASVQIAIFSPRYAESRWCLEELSLMLESGSTVLPVFYNVDPKELRSPQGLYAQSLRSLEMKTTDEGKPRHDPETVAKWRKALSDAAGISGFDLETYDRDEGQLVDDVLQRVLEKVRKTPLDVAKYPTALDGKVEDFERTVLLQWKREESRVIGIVGLGGVGKTTLAKHIFNNYSSKYKKCCSLLDVRRENSLTSLQSIIMKDLAQLDVSIHHSDYGVAKIRKHLQNSSDPVLMLLDDVDHVSQLDALLVPVEETLPSGSLILITSRDMEVLRNSGIVESCIYKQTGLNLQNSRELFCLHAFGQGNPRRGFEQLAEIFVNVCDGLPLSLKVLGASLCGQTLGQWKDKLIEIKNILPGDIRSQLKISYDCLTFEKDIFLDIACFFIGEERDTVIRIWDASHWGGRPGLKKLEDRCLLEVDSENRIRMHSHLRDLGRYLAEEEPREGLRLWHEPNNRQLYDQSLVRGISMVDGYGQSYWSEESFKNLAGSLLVTNMSRLQLLRAEGSCVNIIFTVGYNFLCSFLPSWIPVPSIFRPRQSSQLFWLCWYDCPYEFLPWWIPVQNLVVLQIKGSRFMDLWPHKSQAPLKLRELNIEACFYKIPNSIGNLKHLQKFVLHCKRKMDAVDRETSDAVDLKTLPDGFCELQSLEHLEIKNSKIQSLPQSFGMLTNLQCIHLSGCSNLEILPDSFGDLAKLQYLNLSQCSKLQTLPESLGNLENLQDIDLSRCSALNTLADCFGVLANLQHINLASCFMLQMLPESFGKLRNLRGIDLSSCSMLKALPESFGNLENLQHLDLEACLGLHTLPYSFGNLTNLLHIDLSWCSKLKTLPEPFGSLKSLQHINLHGCSELHTLPDSFGNLRNLGHIDLSWCSNLKTLPESFGNLKKLQHIDLENCSGLHTLPDNFESLTDLRHIDLSWCEHLETCPVSLEKLIHRSAT